MARKVTIKAFNEWVKDEAHVASVLEIVAGGLTLQKASRVVHQPFTCLHGYFESTPELKDRLAGARRAWVQSRKDSLVEKVDELKPDKDHVARLKLEHEIIDNQAKAYHREMWGERLQVDKTVTVGVDRELLASVDELLRLADERVVPALPSDVPDTVTVEEK